MIDIMLACLAWFAMVASTVSVIAFPFTRPIPQPPMYVDMRRFRNAWVRTALEAVIVVLLSLRVLGHI